MHVCHIKVEYLHNKVNKYRHYILIFNYTETQRLKNQIHE
jgi:hypothetical protein